MVWLSWLLSIMEQSWKSCTVGVTHGLITFIIVHNLWKGLLHGWGGETRFRETSPYFRLCCRISTLPVAARIFLESHLGGVSVKRGMWDSRFGTLHLPHPTQIYHLPIHPWPTAHPKPRIYMIHFLKTCGQGLQMGRSTLSMPSWHFQGLVVQNETMRVHLFIYYWLLWVDGAPKVCFGVHYNPQIQYPKGGWQYTPNF